MQPNGIIVPIRSLRAWKTGEVAEWSWLYVDQFGVRTFHRRGDVLPDCLGRRGVPASRRLVVLP